MKNRNRSNKRICFLVSKSSPANPLLALYDFQTSVK